MGGLYLDWPAVWDWATRMDLDPEAACDVMFGLLGAHRAAIEEYGPKPPGQK